MATKASRPKRSRTPASIPEAIEIGIRLIIRSNRPLKPEIVIRAAETRNAPISFGHRDAGGAGDQHRRAGRRPGGQHRHPEAQRQGDAGQPHADAERAHPGSDLGRACVQRLGGLKNDHCRTGEADQNGDEAGNDG
jgi:hypothetical protein